MIASRAARLALLVVALALSGANARGLLRGDDPGATGVAVGDGERGEGVASLSRAVGAPPRHAEALHANSHSARRPACLSFVCFWRLTVASSAMRARRRLEGAVPGGPQGAVHRRDPGGVY